MTLPQAFRVGERVRTLRKTGGLPKGSLGTIVRVFVAAACSDVRFDARPRHQLVSHSDLELVEWVEQAGQP